MSVREPEAVPVNPPVLPVAPRAVAYDPNEDEPPFPAALTVPGLKPVPAPAELPPPAPTVTATVELAAGRPVLTVPVA
jgi:hypothetical protein